MRNFDYRKDYGLIGITIRGYITQLHKEISLLMDTNPIYSKALQVIEQFKLKYENLSAVSSLILKDLLEPYPFEYCYKHGNYPEDASSLGIQFENDLKNIFKLEDELRLVALENWKNELTNFDDIENGEDFIVVGHAAYFSPGTPDFSNYRAGEHSKQFLSCTLFSDKELNTFNQIKTVFITNVDQDNYISSSSEDSVTGEFRSTSFETLKEIKENGFSHYIKVGYTNNMHKAVTTISTPRLIEELSIKREVEENGSLFEYEKSLTNEVVLDRTNTKISGALLISNGCDLLINEYLNFKKNNIKFKCINKGLYKKKYGMDEYSEKEYNEFLNSISRLYNDIDNYIYTNEELLGYYNEVVVPMKYNSEITNMIKQSLGNLEFGEHEFKSK